MKNTTCQLLSALLLSAFFAACSRPVAYVQKSTRETFTTAASLVAPATVTTSYAVETPALVAEDAFTSHAQPVPAMLDQVDALVRSDNKLVVDKTLQKRLNRVRTLLAASAVPSASVETGQKSNLVERMMTKKINKQITKKLSPKEPALNSGTLATGAVLVIIGLLLLLLTSGTAATIGLIALVIGLVALLLGLL